MVSIFPPGSRLLIKAGSQGCCIPILHVVALNLSVAHLTCCEFCDLHMMLALVCCHPKVVTVQLPVMQSAQKEIALWFKPEELAEYNVMTKAAIYE